MLSRRTLIAATALLPAIAWAAPAASGSPAQPPIRPRSDWGASSPVRGRLDDEDDVRFLLVHHTLTPNTDAPGRIPDRLRSIHRFHTSRERGWPDVAYNFFVDRYGTIWEGREGSLTRPVRGDATGGSQGFALLCCFIGDFTAQPPTAEAMAAMTSLLAWLAAREGLDLVGPVTFTSRGSSRWRRGAEVTTEQVAAHRDMSRTECPGDALYPLVAGRLLPDARALLVAPTAGRASEPGVPGGAEPGGPASAGPTPAVGGEPAGVPSGPSVPGGLAAASGDPVPWAVGGAALAAAGAALLLAGRGRRGRSAGHEPHDDENAAGGQGGEQPDQEPPERE